MKVIYILSLVLVSIYWQPTFAEESPSPLQDRASNPDKVHIGPNGVVMPLGRLALVRKGIEYGAVKFTKFWLGKTEDDRYANYISYFQGDGSGDLTRENIEVTREQLVMRRYWGLGHLRFPVGHQNMDVKCGPYKMFWFGGGSLYFFAWGQRQGDYGIELAPTKWTDISQVNAFDPRLKWYRYDEMRPRANIPIDQLWEDGEGKK